MAELEWVEERWWHRLLKVSGCLTMVLALCFFGLVAAMWATESRGVPTWVRPAPPGADVLSCVSAIETIRDTCREDDEFLSGAGMAEKLHALGLITSDEVRRIATTTSTTPERALEELTASRRIGYWLDDSLSAKRIVTAVGATIAATVVFSLLLAALHAFLLYIAHGHTRVRQKA